MTHKRNLFSLSSLRQRDSYLFGAKAAFLGELLSAGLPVPEGSCLPIDMAESLLHGEAISLDEFSEDQVYAVRSSSPVESSGAFAGVFESVLRVQGRAALQEALQRVARSARSLQAEAALRAASLQSPAPIAILVQHFFDADVSGILQTQDPTAPTQLRIELLRGSAEALASGEATPYVIQCPCDSLSLPKLDDCPLQENQLWELILAAKAAEHALGNEDEPLEIEWLFAQDKLWIVQARYSRPQHQQLFWDQGHNPAPLSVAQSCAVAAVEARGLTPYVARVIDGYLFTGKRRGAVTVQPKLSPEFVEFFEEEIAAKILAPLFTQPRNLDEALASYALFCEEYSSGVLSGPEIVTRDLRDFLVQQHCMPRMKHFPTELPALDPVPFLLSGTRTRSFRRDATLYALAGIISRSEVARETIFSGAAPRDIPSEEAHRIWHEFLLFYGDDAPTWDISSPTLREDPRSAYETILFYLDRSQESPEQRRRSVAKKAAALTRTLADALPTEARAAFLDKTAFARLIAPLAEEDDRLFFRAQAFLRKAWLAAGKEAALENLQDSFWLSPEELRSRNSPKVLAELATKARARAAEQRERAPNQKNTSSDLQGEGVSFGRVHGNVRILDSNHAQIETGEILVLPALVPSLSHLLLKAAGLVAEHGGALSHAASLAREYGIPAVVGVRDATKLLHNGQAILLDGQSGTIRYVDTHN